MSDDPHRAEHPPLDDDEREAQRGEDPAETVGERPPAPTPDGDPDPAWQPSARNARRWRAVFDDLAHDHRPRREDTLPYLLIRAMAPGDRGQRPLWPPVPTWESPDILLIDASWSGPFDPNRLVGAPTAGHTYRVFIHVWNLGLLAAAGVHVRAWYVRPGFFGAQTATTYPPTLIGGAMTDLDDRTRPGCHGLVELDAPWVVPNSLTGHECLMATASCPADPWSGGWDANAERHLGQRNLSILAGADDAGPLLAHLGEMIPGGAALEVTHAGPAVLPLLDAVVGGQLVTLAGDGSRHRLPVTAPELDGLRHGVTTDEEQHLLTAVRDGDSTLFARSDALAEMVMDSPLGPPLDPHHLSGADDASAPAGAAPPTEVPAPFAAAGASPRLVRDLSSDRLALVGLSTELPAGQALPQALGSLLDIGNLRAGSLAGALGNRGGDQHLLRFTATDTQGNLIGGYSVIVS